MYKFNAFCLLFALAGCSSPSSIARQNELAQFIVSTNNEAHAAYYDGADQAPRLIKAVSPKAPFRARAKGITGSVEAKAFVNSAGKVISVEILRSPHALLAEAVVKAVSQWVYAPLVAKDVEQGFYFRQTFTFKALK